MATRGQARINPKVAVSVVFVAAMFMSIMDTSIVNVALPSIGRDFRVAPTAVDGISIAFLVSLAVFMPASGWLGDRFGGKRVLMEFVNRVPCLIRPCQIRSIVEGEFNFSMPTGQVENLIQPLEIVSANTLTTDGMFETIYTFEGRVELSNGEAFSFK